MDRETALGPDALGADAELEQLYEMMPFGCCHFDRELRFVRVNARLAEINGLPAAQHIGRTLREVVPAVAEIMEPVYRRVLETGEPVVDLEIEVPPPSTPDEPASWVVSAHPCLGPDGRPRGVMTVVRNVTKRKHMEEALQQNEAQLQMMADALPVLIADVDMHERYRFVNATYGSWVGHACRDVVGRSMREVLGEVTYAIFRSRIDSALSGEPVSFAAEVPFRLGGTRWLESTFVPQRSSDGRAQGFFALSSNITELKLGQERMRDLSRRLLSAQEEERRRLARELHDDLTQRLAALAMEASQVEHTLEQEGSALHERMRSVRDALQQVSADVQAMSHQLHPAILEDLGLERAIRSAVNQLQTRTGIRAEFHASDVPRQLPNEVALTLYRITQESLRNVERHAEASSVRVDLASDGRVLHLRVADDGIGFRLVEGGQAGLGLASMQERARLARGTLDVRSTPGAGTVIDVHIPCPEPTA